MASSPSLSLPLFCQQRQDAFLQCSEIPYLQSFDILAREFFYVISSFYAQAIQVFILCPKGGKLPDQPSPFLMIRRVLFLSCQKSVNVM